MHEALRTFFDNHREKTCACKRAAHDQLGPILDATLGVEQHIRDLQAQLTRAELAPHDAELDGKMEWMHVRLRSALQRCENTKTALRDLAKVIAEVEAGFTEDFKSIGQMQATLNVSPETLTTVAP